MPDTPVHHRLMGARVRRRGPGLLCSAVASLVMLVGCTGTSGAGDPPTSSGPRPMAEPRPLTEHRPLTEQSPLPESRPVRLQIPAIDVRSELIGLGLQDDGTMEVPPGAFPAGWYKRAPTPGELGPAIIAGHVHWNGDRGVFYNLAELRSGDKVTVIRKDGSAAIFRVTRVKQYSKARFPTAEVYGNIDHAGLRLITCGGLDPATGTYKDNVVTFAKLIGHRQRQ